MLATLVVAWSLATGIPTHCFPDPFPWQAMAVYDKEAKAIYHSADTCAMIREFRSPGSLELGALGLLIYGHELAHARGIRSEVRADCIGKYGIGALARKLGASAQRAKRLQREGRYFTTIC